MIPSSRTRSHHRHLAIEPLESRQMLAHGDSYRDLENIDITPPHVPFIVVNENPQLSINPTGITPITDAAVLIRGDLRSLETDSYRFAARKGDIIAIYTSLYQPALQVDGIYPLGSLVDSSRFFTRFFYSAPATKEYVFSIQGSLGGWGSYDLGVAITPNRPVVAAMNIFQTSIGVGDSLTVSDGSFDPEENVIRDPFSGGLNPGIVQRQWSNGSTAYSTTFAFASPGTYPITLTVTSDDGETASVTREIVVTSSQAGSFKFGDADLAFAPQSNFLSLWGTGPANSTGEVRFYDTNDVVVAQRALHVDHEGFWEAVVLPTYSAVRAELWSPALATPQHTATISMPIHPPVALGDVSEFDFELLNKADLLLSLGRSGSSDVLASLYGGTWSHAWMFIGPNEAGTPMIVQAPAPGRVAESIALDEEAVNCREIAIFRFSAPSDLTYSQASQVASAAVNYVGTDYFGLPELALFTRVRLYLGAASDAEIAGLNDLAALYLQMAAEAASALADSQRSGHRVICSTLVWRSYHDALGIDVVDESIVPPLTSLANSPLWSPATIAFLANSGALVVPDALLTGGNFTLVFGVVSALTFGNKMPDDVTMNALNDSAVSMLYPMENALPIDKERIHTFVKYRPALSVASVDLAIEELLLLETHCKLESQSKEGAGRKVFVADAAESHPEHHLDRPSDVRSGYFRNMFRKVLKRVAVCVMLLGICADAVAQGGGGDVALNGMSREVEGGYMYEYSAVNRTDKTVSHFTLDIYGSVDDVRSPPHWISDVKPFLERTVIDWVALLPEHGITPGLEQLSGFAFKSSFGPGEVLYAAIDDSLGGYEGKTVGPVRAKGDYNADGIVNSRDYSEWKFAFGSRGVALAADGNGDGKVDAADYTIWRDSYSGSPGDFDGDDDVDMSDYHVWQQTYGSSDSASDANKDGVVDAADYTVWRDSYVPGNNSQAASTTTPEPTAWLLGLVGLAVTWVFRHHRR